MIKKLQVSRKKSWASSKFSETLMLYIYGSTSNKRCPLITTAPLGIHIKINASPLISTVPLNPVLIRIDAIFY